MKGQEKHPTKERKRNGLPDPPRLFDRTIRRGYPGILVLFAQKQKNDQETSPHTMMTRRKLVSTLTLGHYSLT
jgi:hypothetical protein